MASLKSFLLFIIGGIACASACSRPSGNVPTFCGSNDCPIFTVIEDTEGYQLRKYEATKWVSTEITGMDYDQASREGFNRLFNYISGSNVEGEKVAMTVPVSMKISGDSMTVSFFVPFDHQDNPPAPSSENVFVHEVPEHEVYVRSFTGYADHSEYETEARALSEALQQSGNSFQQDVWFTAGYDAPFRPFNRHNEVWYQKA